MAPQATGYPPGYRFVPTDLELVGYYLARQTVGLPLPSNPILEVEIYNYSPDDIFKNHKLPEDEEGYFFSSRTKKYSQGDRPDRVAGAGFWKATGAKKEMCDKRGTVGYKTSLVYFKHVPKKTQPEKTHEKTNWLMVEYQIKHKAPPGNSNKNMLLDKWVLCKIYQAKRSSTGKARTERNEQANIPQELAKATTPLGNADQPNTMPLSSPLHVPLQLTQVSDKNLRRVGHDMTLDEMMTYYPRLPSLSKQKFVPQQTQMDPILDFNGSKYFQESLLTSDGRFISHSDPQPSHGGHINPFGDFSNMTLYDNSFEASTSRNTEIKNPYQDVDNVPQAPFNYFQGSDTGTLLYQPATNMEGINDQLSKMPINDISFLDNELDLLAAQLSGSSNHAFGLNRFQANGGFTSSTSFV